MKIKSLIIFTLVSFSCGLYAQNRIEERLPQIKERKFFSFIGADLRPYQLPYSVNSNTRTIESSEVATYGTTVGIGREFRISDRWSTSSSLSAFFAQGTKEERGLPPEAEELDIEVANFDRDTRMYGAEFSQSISYDFYSGDYIIRPSLSFGLAYGQAANTLDYRFNDFNDDNEQYTLDVDDSFTTQRVGLELSFFEVGTPLYSFIGASYTTYSISEREFEGQRSVNGSSSTNMDQYIIEAEDTSVITYALGIGYRF